jgi:hypothetical protein
MTHPGTLAPGYLALADAAAWAGVSVRTMKRWIAGGLPVYQAIARGKKLVRPADIDAFLTRQQAPKPDLSRLVNEVTRDLRARYDGLRERRSRSEQAP